MADDPRKSELIAELARSRGELTRHARAAGRELDVAARLKASFQRHRLPWIAGAALLGLLLTRFPRRRRSTPRTWRKPPPEAKAVKAGLLVTALKFAFDIARPALTKWVASRVAQYAGDHTPPRRDR